MPDTLEQQAVGAGARLAVTIADERNDYDEPLRWMASWLLSDSEGDIIAMGRGRGAAAADVPAGVVGYRLRRWFFDGVAPEYEDCSLEAAAAVAPSHSQGTGASTTNG